MRRTFIVMLFACSLALALGAATAWAQDPNYPPRSDSTEVEQVSGVQGRADTAFTGGDVTLPFVALTGLLTLGTLALVVGRRRARDFIAAHG
jgi:hypothetical protein